MAVDHALGGGDDTFITGGLNTQLVDGLVGRGSGNSYAAYCPDCTVAEKQAAIDAAAAGGSFQFTGTYTLGDSTGSGTFNVSAVPEPLDLGDDDPGLRWYRFHDLSPAPSYYGGAGRLIRRQD